ncbi:MAG: helical backbone metal receptor [Bdellovibrionota bacterium]
MRFWKIAKKAFVSGLVLSWSASAGAWSAELVDVTGTKVQVPEHASRVVTLIPSLSELAADLLGEDFPSKIVGVSEYSDYPPTLTKIASIGPYFRFSLERVVALKPDLVLASSGGNSKDQVLHLRELGLAVVVIGSDSMKEVTESIPLVARALGREAQGQQMLKQLETGLAHIRDRARSREPKKVLLELDGNPLVVVGKQSFLNEALELVGARNAYGDSPARYPKPSLEDAVHRDPDTIIVLALGKDIAPFKRFAAQWQEFPSMKAVKSRGVQILHGDPILRPTLRLLEGLGLLEKAIYGQ